MADIEITGVAEPEAATNAVRTLWVESDFPVRLRVARERETETSQPNDLLIASEISEISYRVYREVDDDEDLVAGYESVAVTVADVIAASLPQTWKSDGIGYNFRHVVPAAAFAANCLHRVVYRFLIDSETRWHPVSVQVQGPRGDVGSAGAGTVTGEPGPPGADGTGQSLSFSQISTVTVENTATPTTLIGAGAGTNEIAANSQTAGKKHSIEAAGYFSTTSGDQSVVMTLHLGTEITLTFPAINLLGGLTNERWKLRSTITCRTAGPSGTVAVEAELSVGGVLLQVGTTTPQSIPTDAAKTPDIKIDWATAHLGNSWKCQQYDLTPYGVAT